MLHALNNLFMVVQVCCMINMYLIYIYDIYSFVFFFGGGGGNNCNFCVFLMFHTLVNQNF